MSNILEQYLEQKREIERIQQEATRLREEITSLHGEVDALRCEKDRIINEPYYVKAMKFRKNVKKTIVYKLYSRLRYGRIPSEPVMIPSGETSIETSGKESQPIKEFDYEHMLYPDEYRFLKYKQSRNNGFKINLNKIQVPYRKNLVSVVLPVYNGEDYVGLSVDSILNQSYDNFELIIVDDGSTDKTPQIVDKYALLDRRIKVIHQENRKLPRSLSRGFREARGEYFTWTSADNIMHPQMLEKFVENMKRYNHTGMLYGNLKLIDENGAPKTDFGWYAFDKEHPEYALLQKNTLELNTYPNNYVGAAFMYRAVVANVVEDYSAFKYGIEDYDYWMKINELFTLRHTSFDEPEYSYRLHSGSLTARDKELKITKNRYKQMLLDDFRRDYLLKQQMWIVEADDKQDENYLELIKYLKKRNQMLVTLEEAQRQTKNLYERFIYVKFAKDEAGVGMCNASPDMYKVLVMPETYKADGMEEWDCYICTGSVTEENFIGAYKGWYGIADSEDILSFVDSKAKNTFLYELEADGAQAEPEEGLCSVIISYYGDERKLEKCVQAIRDNNCNTEIIIAGQAEKIEKLHGFDECKKAACLSENDITRKNAAARMAGGEYLFFIQDDCVVEKEYFENIRQVFQVQKKIATVYGNVEVVTNKENRQFARMLGEYRTENDTVYYYSSNNLPGIMAFAMVNRYYKMAGGFYHCNKIHPDEFCGMEYMGMSIRMEISGYYTMLSSEGSMIRHVEDVKEKDMVSIWEKYINARYELEIKTDLPYETWPESILTEPEKIDFVNQSRQAVADANKQLLEVVRRDLREKGMVELNRELFSQPV